MMILGFLLIIFALIVYHKPTLAVGLILALLPSYLVRFQFQGIPTTFLELLVIVFIGLTFLLNIDKLPELRKLKKINWLTLLFLASGIISILISPEKTKALGEFKAFILEPVIFFYAVKIVLKKPQDLKLPLNLLFISSILISLFGIVQYFTLWNLPLRFWGTGVEVERITSVFDYPNALALYLAPLVSFFIALFLSKDAIFNRKNLVAGILILFAALLLTFSRGAWIAFLVTTLALLSLKYSWKKVVVIGIVILGLIFAIPQTRHRISNITKDASSTAHSQLMGVAVREIEINPLFGNGLYGFRTTLMQQNFNGEILNYPHNIFLNFWVEMGLLGLVSFIAIIILCFYQYKVSPSYFKLAGCAFLLTLLIHGLVDVPYFKNDLSILFWFVVSMFYI